MRLFPQKFEFFKQREHTQNLAVPPSPRPKSPRSPLPKYQIRQQYTIRCRKMRASVSIKTQK